MPNSRLALRWSHPLLFQKLNGVKSLTPNTNHWLLEVLDTQVWLLTRHWDGRRNLLTERLCLVPEESDDNGSGRDGKIRQTPGTSRMKFEGSCHSNSHTTLILHVWVWLQGILEIGVVSFNFSSLRNNIHSF